jgi:hypothetical protein
MLKQFASIIRKVKVEAKVEQTRACSSLNLNLDLSLLHLLRPCWNFLLNILRGVHSGIQDQETHEVPVYPQASPQSAWHDCGNEPLITCQPVPEQQELQ